ncbi:DUF6069 family protein [Streptomyces griseorubiginosus]|uniref:DUF6069 family protein n=1 Tax=Streptomyces griseorubiginosus TaxID=67304 RepID=UPI001AD698A3|nr:DUF6069 family protein [Streptomyces griseorubiginosus]MBO4256214.1 hypothetical protein [Streptomyces griseorubiginosus]
MVGALGWAVVRTRSARPSRLLRILVLVVLILSLVPDIVLGVSDSRRGTSWGAVVAFMVMHVVVAAVAVPAYHPLRPLPATQD